jgi:hypothetical protein
MPLVARKQETTMKPWMKPSMIGFGAASVLALSVSLAAPLMARHDGFDRHSDYGMSQSDDRDDDDAATAGTPQSAPINPPANGLFAAPATGN